MCACERHCILHKPCQLLRCLRCDAQAQGAEDSAAPSWDATPLGRQQGLYTIEAAAETRGEASQGGCACAVQHSIKPSVKDLVREM
jgi:hypothetical protein